MQAGTPAGAARTVDINRLLSLCADARSAAGGRDPPCRRGAKDEAPDNFPPNFREVIILRELEGMSYRDIGGITGMPAGTVMSSLSRTRDRLRQAVTVLMSGDTVRSSPRIAAVN